MLKQNNLNTPGSGTAEPAFDRGHLDHVTMQEQSLAVEVLGLFLGQLPASIRDLAEARTAADWRLAAHSLKGAAAAVGARQLSEIASRIEGSAFPGEPRERETHLRALQSAEQAFRSAVLRAFPALG